MQTPLGSQQRCNGRSPTTASPSWRSAPSWRSCSGRTAVRLNAAAQLVGQQGATATQTTGPQRRSDVVALGNLCVDVVIPVNKLPPSDLQSKALLLEQLTAAPQDQSAWEVGGNCNFMIAGARLGMKVASLGHLGSDTFGQWMEAVLQGEQVVEVQRVAPDLATAGSSNLDQTLVCFVLVDQQSQHAFCSRYDLGPWPLLRNVKELPPTAAQLIKGTRAVFMNGFVFDELPLDMVVSAINLAHSMGAAIFFDPGPRCHTMTSGDRQAALHAIMDLSDVILMTEEEARIVTGKEDAEEAAKVVMARPGARTQWAVVKMGGKGALLRARGSDTTFTCPGYKVEVQDTVGCGDSFAAAIVMGFINKAPIPATLALANAVGAATATGRGAGRNVATADKVLRLLDQASQAFSHPGQQEHVGQAKEMLQSMLALQV